MARVTLRAAVPRPYSPGPVYGDPGPVPRAATQGTENMVLTVAPGAGHVHAKEQFDAVAAQRLAEGMVQRRLAGQHVPGALSNLGRNRCCLESVEASAAWSRSVHPDARPPVDRRAAFDARRYSEYMTVMKSDCHPCQRGRRRDDLAPGRAVGQRTWEDFLATSPEPDQGPYGSYRYPDQGLYGRDGAAFAPT